MLGRVVDLQLGQQPASWRRGGRNREFKGATPSIAPSIFVVRSVCLSVWSYSRLSSLSLNILETTPPVRGFSGSLRPLLAAGAGFLRPSHAATCRPGNSGGPIVRLLTDLSRCHRAHFPGFLAKSNPSTPHRLLHPRRGLRPAVRVGFSPVDLAADDPPGRASGIPTL